MPTYEYRCKDCGNELEVVQSFTDDALTTCEACGGSLRKVFGNVGIAFKGTGFYKNDSRGKKAAAGTSADKSGADKPSTGTDGGSTSSAEKSSSDAGSSATKDGGATKKKDAPVSTGSSTST